MNQLEILNELNHLTLLAHLYEEELEVLKGVKIKYQHNDNLVRVVHGIKSALTPLAIQGKLSKESTALFKNLAQNNFWNKRTGIGPFSM